MKKEGKNHINVMSLSVLNYNTIESQVGIRKINSEGRWQ